MAITNVLMKAIVDRQLYDIKFLIRKINKHDYDTARNTLANMNNNVKDDLNIARKMYFEFNCTETSLFYAQCLKYKTEINKFNSKM